MTPVNETQAELADHARGLSKNGTNEMQRILMVALAVMALGVAGCAEGKYPISGETCGPNDPVKALDANDCLVPPGT